MMDDLLKNLRAVNESDDRYSTKVEVDVHIEGVEIESVSDLTIQYDLNFESREWGIKDVDFVPRGDADIDVEVMVAGNKNPITVRIDPKNAKISWVPGHRYAPQSVNIVATKDGKVGSVEIVMEYLVPD